MNRIKIPLQIHKALNKMNVSDSEVSLKVCRCFLNKILKLKKETYLIPKQNLFI